MKRNIAISLRTVLIFAWLVAGVIYLAISLRSIRPNLRLAEWHPSEAFFSTDTYLAGLTGQGDESRLLLDAFARAAPDKAIVLVLPDNSPHSAFMEENVSYLGWPHEVRWLCANSPDVQNELFRMSPSSVAEIFFWDTTPFASLPPGTRIGPGQVIILLSSP